VSEGSPKRWVWDFYPLAKDSWGEWELEPEMPRPGHRIYMYRHQGDGYFGEVMELGKLHAILPPTAKVIQREACAPTKDHFVLLKRCYPDDDPHHPDWNKINAELRVADYDQDQMYKSDALTLLGYLQKVRNAEANDSQNMQLAKRSIFRRIKSWHKILVGIGAAIGSIVTVCHFCAEPLKNLLIWLLR